MKNLTPGPAADVFMFAQGVHLVKATNVDAVIFAQLFMHHLVEITLDHEPENLPAVVKTELECQHFGEVICGGQEAVFQVDCLGDCWLLKIDHHIVGPEVHVHDVFAVQGMQQVERYADQALDIAPLREPFQPIEVPIQHLGKDEIFLNQAKSGLAVTEAVEVGYWRPALLCTEGVDHFLHWPIERTITLCAAEGHTQFWAQAVEGLGFGEQVAFHPFQRCADAVLQRVACVDQILNRLPSTHVSAVCGENRRVAMAECRWKALEHASVRKAQSTSLSFMKYVGYVTGQCHWIQPEPNLSDSEINCI